MRLLWAAGALLISAQVCFANDLAFWDRIAKVSADQSLVAYQVMECNVAAAEAIARRDQVTPAVLMADAAAKEAATQCDGKALTAAVGESEAAVIMAAIRGISAERALRVRRGEPPYLCADGRACPMK